MNWTHDRIGGVDHFYSNLPHLLPYVIVICIEIVIGFFGNFLIIGAIVCSEELKKNTTNIIVFNLAITDFVISSIVNGFMLIGIFGGKSFFANKQYLCFLFAATCLIACVTSMMSITTLAINRYLNICWHKYYHKVFNFRNTVLFCMLTWIIGICLDTPNMLGWGGHFYDQKSLMCAWNRRESHSWRILLPMTAIKIPSLCVFICYMKIFLFVQSKQSVKAQKKKSIQVAKGLFASFMFFVVCWTPYGLVIMLDHHDRFPPEAYMYSIQLGHFNSAANPLFYAVFNPAFKRGYKLLFAKLALNVFFAKNEKTSFKQITQSVNDENDR